MKEQQGMHVHPIAMMVLVAAISVMLTVIVMNMPTTATTDGFNSIGASQTVASSSSGQQLYYSTMHPWVVQDHPGTCPICGMDLVPMPAEEQAKYVANHPEFS